MEFTTLNPNAKKTKNMEKWLSTLKLSPNVTEDDLKKYGFMDYDINKLCLKKKIKYPKEYIQVDFRVVVDTSIWDIHSFEIMNSDFVEPYFCDETSYLFIIDFIGKLITDGILEKRA